MIKIKNVKKEFVKYNKKTTLDTLKKSYHKKKLFNI